MQTTPCRRLLRWLPATIYTADARSLLAAPRVSEPLEGEAVAEALRVETGSPAIIIASLDLASLRSVGACVAQLLSDNGPLHILVNDVGLISRDLRRTDDGFAAHFRIPHLGHFALAKGLLPALRTADNARIVSLTSVAHRMSDVDLDDPNFLYGPYDHLPAYAASKTATSLFTVGCMQIVPTETLRPTRFIRAVYSAMSGPT